MFSQNLNTTAEKIIQILDSHTFPNNSVIVYDIDDTLLDYNGQPIAPIIQTYNHALDKGLIPVIITSRTGLKEVIDHTIQQLKANEINHYKYLYLRPMDKEDPFRFKMLCRKDLHDRGYYVAMSIGDQPWDIGNYGGIGIIV